jgi:hypothetical protein
MARTHPQRSKQRFGKTSTCGGKKKLKKLKLQKHIYTLSLGNSKQQSETTYTSKNRYYNVKKTTTKKTTLLNWKEP